jgi:hypothetical protein
MNIPASGLTIANLTIDKPIVGGNNDDFSAEENNEATLVATGTVNLIQGDLTRSNYVSGMTSTAIESQGGAVYIGPEMNGAYGNLRLTGNGRTINFSSGGSRITPALILESTSTIFNVTGSATATLFSLTINAGTFNSNDSNLSVNSLFLSGASSTYNSGAGNVYVDTEFRCYYGSSASFGTGYVQIGTTVRTFADCTIDMHEASSLILVRNNAQPVSTFILGYNTGNLTDGHTTWWLPNATTTIAAPTVSISGGATINPNNGTVVLNGTNQVIVGAPTFYNLVQTVSATNSLRFTAATTTVIMGNLTLTGTGTSTALSVHSTVTGTQAMIDVRGTATTQYLDVQDIRNVNTVSIAAGATVIDSGNNDGWTGMIDFIAPTAPGALTLNRVDPGSAKLTFGATSSDANFLEYHIYYKQGTSGVTTTDSRFTSSTDSNLGDANFYGHTSTTVSGLDPNVSYVFRIMAHDEYGNNTWAPSETVFYSSANLPANVRSAGVGTSTVNVAWDVNSNPTTTEFEATEVGNTSRTSGWTTSTNYIFSNLSPHTNYYFQVRARNVSATTTGFVAMTQSALTDQWSSGVTPALPPPPVVIPVDTNPTEGNTDTETPPTVNHSIVINDDAPETNSRNVLLTFAVANVASVAVSNDPTFNTASFVPYVTTMPWTLTTGYGTKTVYARFRSAAGAILNGNDSINFVPLTDVVVSATTTPPATPVVPDNPTTNEPITNQPDNNPTTPGDTNNSANNSTVPNNSNDVSSPSEGGAATDGSGVSYSRLTASDIRVWLAGGRIQSTLPLSALEMLANDTLVITVADTHPAWSHIRSLTLQSGTTTVPFAHAPQSHVYTAAYAPDTTTSLNQPLTVRAIYDNGVRDMFALNVRVQPLGQVSDALTRVPLDHALVTLYRTDETGEHLWPSTIYAQQNPITTDATGDYGFVVPNGSYTLLATHDGYAEYRSPLTITNHLVQMVLPLTAYDAIATANTSTLQNGITSTTVVVTTTTPRTLLSKRVFAPSSTVARVLATVEANTAIVTEAVTAVIDSPIVEQQAKRAAPISVGVTTISLLPYLMESAIPLLRYVFLQPLMFLGIRRKKEWGTVTSITTGTPIDLVLVRLIDTTSGRIVQTRVTDTQGRYLFTVPPGSYRIEVQKAGYGLVRDGVGETAGIYHGENITIASNADTKNSIRHAIAPNIFLSSTAQSSRASHVIWQRRYKQVSRVLASLGIITSGITLFVLPTLISVSLFLLQIVSTAMLRRATKMIHPIEQWGRVRDIKTGLPVAGSIVRLYAAAQHKLIDTQITDAAGRYGFFVGPNKYIIQSEKSGYYSAEKTIDIDPRRSVDVIAESLSLEPLMNASFKLSGR